MYITVTQVSMDFILIDNGESQKKGHGTLCKIFNELEKDGYTLVGAGGSVCIHIRLYQFYESMIRFHF